ncbi:hypothetical protein [Leptothoe spongobia]|uniref:Uncharacterized protein n=1 Tax=Leptothoe spongobia TAU-MAC 1115 TaxID=1967444 RepID=A0A947DGC4_9CYAN|nr:hypothetical protein [Leptothoe spongobia]MBT9316245.1 hypothetical protein [Leptothoe spongobia TAU-MAC 1115]
MDTIRQFNANPKSADTSQLTETINPLTARQNQSLKSLARTLSLSAHRFTLILVRSNQPGSLDNVFQQLNEHYSVQPRILYLPENSRSLFSAIQSVSLTFQGLMVIGLDDISDLDEFLITTNQMRNEFRHQFHFPVVLWANDETIGKLVKLAPDFYSWASGPINLDC